MAHVCRGDKDMSLHIPGVAGWLAGVRGIRSYSLIYTGYTLTHPATHSDTIYQPCSIIIHPFSILALLVTQPSTHSSTISTLLNHYPSLFYYHCYSLNHPPTQPLHKPCSITIHPFSTSVVTH